MCSHPMAELYSAQVCVAFLKASLAVRPRRVPGWGTSLNGHVTAGCGARRGGLEPGERDSEGRANLPLSVAVSEAPSTGRSGAPRRNAQGCRSREVEGFGVLRRSARRGPGAGRDKH